MAAGAFAGQWGQAHGEKGCPIASDESGQWSNTIICVLCVLGLVGILKMIYDIVHAYWELCVRQAAARLDRSSGPVSAADNGLGQMPTLEGSADHEGDQGSLAETVVPRVSLAAPVARPSALVSEGPIYVPEMMNSPLTAEEQQVHDNCLPEAIFFLKSGEVYHTELGCHHVVAQDTRPVKRCLRSTCLQMTQRRIAFQRASQRSENEAAMCDHSQ